jgi:hypothetical protein
MADSADSRGIRFDDIAARVNPDPSAGTPTLLAGFVGKGDAEGRVRIYPDLSFGTYYDVAEADVVHSVPLPAESSPHGGSYVWVKAGAQIGRGPAASAAALPIPPFHWTLKTEIFSCPDCPDTFADCVVNPFTSTGNTCPVVGCTLPPTTTGTCPQSPCQPTLGGTTCHHPVCAVTATVVGPRANAQFQPTPAATFFHTCGLTQPLHCPTFFAATCAVCPVTIPCAAQPAQANLFAAARPSTMRECTMVCDATQVGQTCPNGDCTFVGTCPHVCGHTRAGFTCGPRDCTIACDAAQAFRQPINFAQAATPPFSLQQSCGIACTIGPTVCQDCPPPCTVASTLCPTVNDQTCQPPCPPPPCTVASTLCPTVNDQTCQPPCPPPPCTVGSTQCPTVNDLTCPAPCPPVTAVCTPNCTLPSVTCPITPVTRTGVFNPLG